MRRGLSCRPSLRCSRLGGSVLSAFIKIFCLSSVSRMLRKPEYPACCGKTVFRVRQRKEPALPLPLVVQGCFLLCWHVVSAAAAPALIFDDIRRRSASFDTGLRSCRRVVFPSAFEGRRGFQTLSIQHLHSPTPQFQSPSLPCHPTQQRSSTPFPHSLPLNPIPEPQQPSSTSLPKPDFHQPYIHAPPAHSPHRRSLLIPVLSAPDPLRFRLLAFTSRIRSAT
ncbi:hypothetical protein NA56DRAFT_147969 [Hyaloscypha hepaticicola]|uniref:Uncharacterized protein n=1 Tax=Hyaloscypha hepaticicola TaxID=2082293 RepID=A0A2J6QNG6_9HELO|nr:hypothetical protein NA56DRAFT_147969 [Hyaloscypha hepaticicola]